MAKDGGGDILTIVLIGGGAWLAWNLYQGYLAAQYAAASAAATPPATPATTTAAPPATPAIIIPANFTVTPDVNNSFKGIVTYNGYPTSFNLIFSGGQATGEVFNSAGNDVTQQLGAANVTTLVNAFNAAVQNELIQGTITKATGGMSGLGQVRARIPVPHMMLVRRIGIEG